MMAALPADFYAEAPVVPVLLLGDAGVGKSTFLSRLRVGHEYRGALPQLRDLDQVR